MDNTVNIPLPEGSPMDMVVMDSTLFHRLKFGGYILDETIPRFAKLPGWHKMVDMAEVQCLKFEEGQTILELTAYLQHALTLMPQAEVVPCEPCHGHGARFEMGWIPSPADQRCRTCDGRGVVAK